jgi:phosphopantetheinyl transferase (holo-ACP synthase)
VKKSKHGNPELMTCRRQRKENPFSVKAAQEAISKGMSVPSFDYFFLQIETLQRSLARQRLPINQALQLALERYGLTTQLMEENGPRAREKDKGPVLESEQSV